MSARLLITLVVLAASHAFADAPKTFTVRGVLREVKAAGHKLIIKHEAIPGYMEAMVMPFTVKDAAITKDLKPGDHLTFTLHVTDDADWIEKIEVTGHEAIKAEPKLQAIQPGDAMPDAVLRDEQDKPFHLCDLKDKAVLITFIYTRCPFPTMCPLLSSKFSEVQQDVLMNPAVKAEQWKLISVCIDPDHDTAVARQTYAKVHGANPSQWCIATNDQHRQARLGGRDGPVHGICHGRSAAHQCHTEPAGGARVTHGHHHGVGLVA